MAETADNTYKTKSDNTADTTPNIVAVINDGTGDRQVVVLGAGDGTTNLNDGSSAHPVRTDPTGSTTQPVSAASLPLPSGAATAAKQPALGTAGSASTDVITVQGIASGTAQPVNGTVTANAGTNLNTSALALETGGNLAAIKADTDKIPSQGQALAAASSPVVLPAGQITTLTPPTNTGYALDSSLSTIDTDLKSNITLHAGSNVIGHVIADTGSTTAVTQATASNLNATVVGTGTFAVQSVVNPQTSGGLSMGGSTALTNTAGGVAVKASAGQVYGWYIYNPNSTVAYVQFYNTTTGNTTIGTNPLNPIGIPAAGASNVFTNIGLTFSTAITIAATTTPTGSTAPSTALVANIYYN